MVWLGVSPGIGTGYELIAKTQEEVSMAAKKKAKKAKKKSKAKKKAPAKKKGAKKK